MKKNFKYTLITMAVMIVITVIGVYASDNITSRQVTYDNTSSKLSSTNVQEAIDEIYSNINNCPNGYLCKETKTIPEPGDYVKMTPTLTSYTTDTSKTGYSSTETINPSELDLWRVLKVNSDGTIEIISEYASSEYVHFNGKTGYQNFIGYLNVLASKYENSKYTKGSRYVGYNGQTEYITNTSKLDSTTAPWTSSTGSSTTESLGGGDTLYQSDYDLIQKVFGTAIAKNVSDKSADYYWMASRYYDYDSPNWYFVTRLVYDDGDIGDSYLYRHYGDYSNENDGNLLRPIVILKSGITYTPAVGTSDDPFVLD